MERSPNRQRRNITLGQRRTSVSLEEQIWDGINDICRREAVSIDELCRAVEMRRVESSMSSALRIFLLTYFRHVVEGFEDGANGQPPVLTADRASMLPDVLQGALQRFHEEQKAVAGLD